MIKKLTNTDRRVYSLDPQPKMVMRCEPLALSVMLENREGCCNYCLREGETLRCQACKHYHYCSRECQTSDWKQHKKECNIIKQIAHTIPSPILLLFRCYLNGIDLTEFYGSAEEVVDKQKLDQFQEGALIVLNYSNKQFENIGALITLQIKIQLNSFTVTNKFGDPIGLGLYSPSNFFNHRCSGRGKYKAVANCYHFYSGRSQYILLNDNHRNLEELTISYTVLEDYTERRKFLKENYNFECECERCLDEGRQQPEEQQLKQTQRSAYEVLTEKYLAKLEAGEFIKALKALEQLIQLMPNYWEDSRHPFIGWRLAEAGKLAYYCDYLKKAKEYCESALEILGKYFSSCTEYNEIVQRLQDVEMSMSTKFAKQQIQG